MLVTYECVSLRVIYLNGAKVLIVVPDILLHFLSHLMWFFAQMIKLLAFCQKYRKIICGSRLTYRNKCKKIVLCIFVLNVYYLLLIVDSLHFILEFLCVIIRYNRKSFTLVLGFNYFRVSFSFPIFLFLQRVGCASVWYVVYSVNQSEYVVYSVNHI